MTKTLRTVVTGGTRGIGAAVAQRLAGEGHDVIALGRRERRSSPVPGARVGHAEVTNASEVSAAFSKANDDGAGLTGLVVSAGIWEPSPMTGDVVVSSKVFQRILDVNLLGTILCASAFLQNVRAGADDLSIVLIGSTAGQRGEAGYSAYAASKAALNGLAKSWAVELAPRGIRVNVVAPGWVDTEMAESALADPGSRALIEASIPRGRVASADDIAGPVAFLLSPDARHVTGSVISVNGGGVLASF